MSEQPPAPAPGAPAHDAPPAAGGAPGWPAPYGQQPPPGQGWPPAGYPPGQGYPGQGYPGQGYGPQPGWPPYPGPSPYPPAYPPAPPGRRRWPLWVALGVVLFVGGCGGLGYAGYHYFKGSIGAARTATDDYYAALARGDDAAAYDLTCSSQRAALRLSDFARTVDARPVAGWDHNASVHVSSVNGHSSGTVGGTVRYRDGSRRLITVPLVKEGDRWLVCEEPDITSGLVP